MAVRSRSWRPTETATPSRTALERIAEREKLLNDRREKATANVAALGSRAPLLYGRVQTQGLIAAVAVGPISHYVSASLYLLAVWGEGEITAVDGLITSGEPSTIARVDYLGTPTQGVDPWLAEFLPNYADTLRGTYNQRAVSLAYSVLKVSSSDSFPNAPTALIRGLKIYDPRTGLRAYSTNPALILGDILTRAGETVDWTASLAAINYCDETVGIAPDRWTCSLVINSPADVYEHVEMLRAYAHCLVDHTATGIRLVPDKATSVSRALTASDIVAGSLTLNRPARRDTPTYVRIGFTDTAPPAGKPNGPWGTAYAAAAHPGLATGEAPWIEAGLTLAGIQNYQEASRSAIERLNAYTLRNLYADCVIRDEGLAVAVGDVVTLTHPIGLTAKPLRVLSVDDQTPGRYKLRLEEYDPAVYSNAIVEDPTYPDTVLPSPFTVPAPTQLAAEELLYRRPNGSYATRLLLSWALDDYPYAHHFRARLSQGGRLVWSAYGTDTDATTTEVIPGLTYDLLVCAEADIGITGPWADLEHQVVVLNYPPTDVTVLYAMETGGEVRLSWPPASDTDIWRYELRWGAVPGSWDTATLLDRIDGLRLVTRDIPAGTWRFWVKALDASGQYSAGAAWADVVVTLDDYQFFVGSMVRGMAAWASSNIYTTTDRAGLVTAWTEASDLSVNAVWGNVANTYPLLACVYSIASPMSVAPAKFYTYTWDIGTTGTADNYTGALTATFPSLTALVGTFTSTLQTSLDNVNWTNHTGNPIKGTMAYARIKIASEVNNGFLLRGEPTLRLDVKTREESGKVTTLASGAKTITLDNTYAKASAISLTAGSSTAARTAVYDNIVLGTPTTFNVYLFNASGTQIAGEVSYRFIGV